MPTDPLSLYTWNGALLQKGSALATDINCCCFVDCCDLLNFYDELDYDLIFYGPNGCVISGRTNKLSHNPEPDECAVRYGFQNIDFVDCTEFTLQPTESWIECCDVDDPLAGKLRARIRITSSLPCELDVTGSSPQISPCCPFDVTISLPGGGCGVTGIDVRLRTPDSPPCPEDD